jgi:hypothetical protein
VTSPSSITIFTNLLDSDTVEIVGVDLIAPNTQTCEIETSKLLSLLTIDSVSMIEQQSLKPFNLIDFKSDSTLLTQANGASCELNNLIKLLCDVVSPKTFIVNDSISLISFICNSNNVVEFVGVKNENVIQFNHECFIDSSTFKIIFSFDVEVIEQSVCDESSFSVSSISTLKCNFAF